MDKRLAAILLVAGAGALSGCAYDPYSGTYVPAGGYNTGGYAPYYSYGYPGYGYPDYGSYGGGFLGWGGGYSYRDQDRRDHRDYRDYRQGQYRGEHRDGGYQPGNAARPAHPASPPHVAVPSGGHAEGGYNPTYREKQSEHE